MGSTSCECENKMGGVSLWRGLDLYTIILMTDILSLSLSLIYIIDTPLTNFHYILKQATYPSFEQATYPSFETLIQLTVLQKDFTESIPSRKAS